MARKKSIGKKKALKRVAKKRIAKKHVPLHTKIAAKNRVNLT